MYLIGLAMCTEGAVYVIEWLDHFTVGWNVLVISAVECIVISWVYGVQRFTNDVGTMIGDKKWQGIPMAFLSLCWTSFWCVVTPFFLISTLVFSMIEGGPLRIEVKSGIYTYPAWSNTLGTAVFVSICLIIVAPGVIRFCRGGQRSISGAVKTNFKPSIYWGPSSGEHRFLVSRYTKDYVIDPWFHEQMEKYTTAAVRRSLSCSSSFGSLSWSGKRSYVSDLDPIEELEEPPPESPV